MDEYTHIIDNITSKKGLFINTTGRETTGREPTYIIMNDYTYKGLIRQLAHQALTVDPTITFEEAVGLEVAIIPIDKRKEIYVEVV